MHITNFSQVVLNLAWQVVAGEESKEVESENQRELRVLEAVYPRPSAIPLKFDSCFFYLLMAWILDLPTVELNHLSFFSMQPLCRCGGV